MCTHYTSRLYNLESISNIKVVAIKDRLWGQDLGKDWKPGYNFTEFQNTMMAVEEVYSAESDAYEGTIVFTKDGGLEYSDIREIMDHIGTGSKGEFCGFFDTSNEIKARRRFFSANGVSILYLLYDTESG